MKLAIKEKAIENHILSYLKIKGFLAFKIESQGTFDVKLGRYRLKHSIHRKLGISDIFFAKEGQWGLIEVKSATGRLSDHQKLFMKEVLEQGGTVFVARSIEDVEKHLTGAA